MLRIGVLTTGRQDWGILRSTCKLLRGDPAFDLRILAGGMALSRAHGRIVDAMTAEGFPPAELLDWAVDEERPDSEAAAALGRMGEALRRQELDALVLLGDRYETISAAIAATVLRVPVVHLHGGEETEGAFDNAIRHALTKLAHLHFVSHAAYARRVLAMGEDPAAVHVVGAPGLDNLRRDDLPSREEIEARVGLPLRAPIVVVTLHPTTLGGDPEREAAAVVTAMDAVEATYVVTLPNADPGAALVRDAMLGAARRPRRIAVDALGERMYWGLLRVADAMLGNSSSGILEAPAVGLPVVNVGPRQRGRLRGPNVIDVEPDAGAVVDALRRAIDSGFRASIAEASRATFGDGRAAERIVEVLRAWAPPRPPIKRWHDA